jgi:hypothetical protein
MGFDKSKRYKFVNGKFVERTPEEQAELERKRAAHLAASGQGPTVKAAQAKLPRSNERFIRVTLSQANRLLWLKPQAFVAIYLLLSLESFKAHGQPFIWPDLAGRHSHHQVRYQPFGAVAGDGQVGAGRPDLG